LIQRFNRWINGGLATALIHSEREAPTVAMIMRIIHTLRISDAAVTVAAASQSWLSSLMSRWTAPALPDASISAFSPQTCPECHTQQELANGVYQRFAICERCGHHFVWSARARIEQLADPETFQPIGRAIYPLDFLGFMGDVSYAIKLRLEQLKTGLRDAAIIGRCRIGHVDVVLATMDFHFMGGSMGSVVGEQITVAFEYALRHRLPVVTVVNSGGARMQEGSISLMQMPKTAAAAQRLHAAGLFYCSVLASPTTGGVFASFANLGDVILAEPKAIIGFAGPRVAEQVLGKRIPEGSHRAEALLDAGLLDAIVPRQELPQVVGALLLATVRAAPARQKSHGGQLLAAHAPAAPVASAAPANSAWDTVGVARRPDRPTALDYIRFLSPTFVELHGDRCYGDDPAMVTGLGAIEGRAILFAGEQRFEQRDGAMLPVRPKPEGFRKAIRMMELATRLNCPLITFIDTTGADPSPESERHGIGWSLAQCLATMSDMPVPTVAVIIGEGASGGAVALALADHVMMLQQAIYEVIAPEGAATILYRDAQRAAEVADQLKLTAADCLALGIVETIIPEPLVGAQADPLATMQAIQRETIKTLATLEHLPVRQLLARRYRKFRRFGRFQYKRPKPAETRLANPRPASAL
jgi:acetyl-CoA carboxylase carboxyl transferase subunit beta